MASILSESELKLWPRMSRADRRHAVGVAREVERQLGREATTPVLAAALLHDVGKVSAGLGKVRSGLSDAVAGVDKLDAGTGKAYQGSKKLTDGLGQLSDGQHQVATGLPAAVDGTGQLADGLGAAVDGAKQIQGGIDQAHSQAFGPLETQLTGPVVLCGSWR